MITEMKPIGFVRHKSEHVPRHWSVSNVEGNLVINEEYVEGLDDIKAGQKIVVIFYFHKGQDFVPRNLKQTPPHSGKVRGVFSCCSPRRPNPIGMSVLEVLEIKGNVICVKGIDMYDGTPVLDIKPHIIDKHTCPSFEEKKE